jgi:flagellar biosynthesis protein FlhB
MKSICLLSSLIIALYILYPVQSGNMDMHLELYKNEVLYANQIYFHTDRICKLFITAIFTTIVYSDIFTESWDFRDKICVYLPISILL